MSQYCVLGRHGFIGSAIAKRLGNVTSFPTPDTKVVFHFASYTHPDFERNPEYHIKAILDSFNALLPYCKQRGIQFVYPSSALVYEKDTQFARFKKTLEQLAASYETRTLGVRIFPTYGPGEQRTVISSWCRQMLAGDRPKVYGDGEQARDFIFIDDVVDQILEHTASSRWQSKITDVGTGKLTKFNDIVRMINKQLGTNLEPEYVYRPSSYSEGISCQDPGPTNVSIPEGIARICKTLL